MSFTFGPEWARDTRCCGKPVGCTNPDPGCLMHGHPWKRRHVRRPMTTIGRRVNSLSEIERPGDYCGPVKGYTGDLEACFFLKPNARDEGVPPWARSLQHVCFPPHTYRECPDGSLEIRASIGSVVHGDDDGWHGYLDEGHVWRQV